MLRRFALPTSVHHQNALKMLNSVFAVTNNINQQQIRSFHASFRAPPQQQQQTSSNDPNTTPKVYDLYESSEEQNRSSPPQQQAPVSSFSTSSRRHHRHRQEISEQQQKQQHQTEKQQQQQQKPIYTISEDELYEQKIEERRRLMNLDSAFHPQQPTPFPGSTEYMDLDSATKKNTGDSSSSSSSLDSKNNSNTQYQFGVIPPAHKRSDPLTRPAPTAPFPHPEELVKAVSDFVQQAKDLPPPEAHIPMLGKKEEIAIARMDAILFHEGFVPDTEKFRVVRALVYFDSIRMNKRYLLPALHEILRLLVPETIFQVLRDVDVDEDEKFQDIESMEAIEEFFGTVIEGQATDEEYTKMFVQLQKKVKALAHLKSFGTFVHEFDKLIAQSQTAAAVTEACLEFDPHGYGRIKAFEMRLALQAAIPEANFSDENKHLKNIIIDEIMLEVAEQTEEDGYVAYQQLRKS